MVKQWIIDVLDTVYPTQPQVVVPFDPDSFLITIVGGAPNGDGGFFTPTDVDITFDAVIDADPVQLTVRTSGPLQSVGLNDRAHRIFLKGADTGGTRVQINAVKAK